MRAFFTDAVLPALLGVAVVAVVVVVAVLTGAVIRGLL